MCSCDGMGSIRRTGAASSNLSAAACSRALVSSQPPVALGYCLGSGPGQAPTHSRLTALSLTSPSTLPPILHLHLQLHLCDSVHLPCGEASATCLTLRDAGMPAGCVRVCCNAMRYAVLCGLMCRRSGGGQGMDGAGVALGGRCVIVDVYNMCSARWKWLLEGGERGRYPQLRRACLRWWIQASGHASIDPLTNERRSSHRVAVSACRPAAVRGCYLCLNAG